MILLDNVSKAFNNKWAVRGINLHVNKGEIFGLVGPNTAGKTTTIKMLTGLIQPTEGKISIDGYDIVQEPLKVKTIIGYVPDRAFLYEKLKGYEFLIFIASIHGIEKSVAIERINKLLEQFGVKKISEELIESYSQGMRQRILFISALIHNPKVLFIDEPFIGLDPFGIKMIEETMQRLNSEGVTIFLATHSLHIAEKLCNRVGIINKGTLICIKNIQEIIREGGLHKVFLNITS